MGEARRLESFEPAAPPWPRLYPQLAKIARALAPKFDDVACEADILGDLALMTHERWLTQWLEGTRDGSELRPLKVFLRHRMRDQLKTRRRKARRRRELLHSGVIPREPLFTAEPRTPDEDLGAKELRRQLAEPAVALREAGYSGREIANALGVSPPTVSRRLALAAAILASTLAALALFVDSRPEPPPTVPLRPSHDLLPTPSAGDEEPAPRPRDELGDPVEPPREGGRRRRREPESIEALPPSEALDAPWEPPPPAPVQTPEPAPEPEPELLPPLPEGRVAHANVRTAARLFARGRYVEVLRLADELRPMPRGASLLIESIRALGLRVWEAEAEGFVARFPSHPRASTYRNMLRRSPVGRARRCALLADYACVVRELGTRSERSAEELRLLGEALHTLGRSSDAQRVARRASVRFPHHPQTEQLRASVRRRRRVARREPAPPPVARPQVAPFDIPGVRRCVAEGDAECVVALYRLRPIPDRVVVYTLRALEQDGDVRRVEEAAERFREAAPGPTTRREVLFEAVTCASRHRPACVVRLLEGRADDERRLGLLTEAYRALHLRRAATRSMRRYATRYSDTVRAGLYRRRLEARAPARPRAGARLGRPL